MLKIGNKAFPSSLILAPMAGISDLPYRMVNRSVGCGLAFTEMISTNALVHKSLNTLKMLSTTEADRPLGVQLLGNDPDLIRKSLELISEYSFDIVDFNAACPVAKVVSGGRGAGLLREPARLQKLLRIIVENTSVPVTVKIRSGWDESSVNAVHVALCAQDAGVKGLIIHGRTRKQGYRGNVDYETIREVKESLEIPVIASGDALSPVLVKKLFDETGCDGVTLARGVLGNPWIFREIGEYLTRGTVPPRPGADEIAQTMKKHLVSSIAFSGEKMGVLRFRKFFGWYTRGLAVRALKSKAYQAVTGDDMLHLIEQLERMGSCDEEAINYPLSSLPREDEHITPPRLRR